MRLPEQDCKNINFGGTDEDKLHLISETKNRSSRNITQDKL